MDEGKLELYRVKDQVNVLVKVHAHVGPHV
jgi:hypothetical protein